MKFLIKSKTHNNHANPNVEVLNGEEKFSVAVHDTDGTICRVK